MTTFKLWDTVEKNFLPDGNGKFIFPDEVHATIAKMLYLDMGNYIDRSQDCIQVMEYEDDKFKQTVS